MLLRRITTVLAAGLFLMTGFIIVKSQPSTHSEVQEKVDLQFLVILASSFLFGAGSSVFTKAGKNVFETAAAYAAVLPRDQRLPKEQVIMRNRVSSAGMTDRGI